MGRELRVVTHDGMSHPDEAFVLAMIKWLCINVLNVKYKFKRTRDPGLINAADIAIDVGNVYDPEHFRYDHHGPEGAGRRPEKAGHQGISYSSFGIFWKDHGLEFVSGVVKKLTDYEIPTWILEKAVGEVDRNLVEGTCALDTGEAKVRSNNIRVPSLHSAFSVINPTWIEASGKDARDNALWNSLPMMGDILIGYIMRSVEHHYSESYVMQGINSCRDGILVLKTPTQAWRRLVNKSRRGNEILTVVQPQMDDAQTWCVHAVEDGEGTLRIRFPEEWGGLEQDSLRSVTGNEKVTFVHTAGFIAAAEDKQSAIMLAKLGIAKYQKEDEYEGAGLDSETATVN